MIWKSEQKKEGRRTWTDWVSGRYRVEQGRDVWEARQGRPWLLLRVHKNGKHKRISAHESLEAAKKAAADRVSGQINQALETLS